MTVTVIKANKTIRQIFVGKVTQEIKNWIEQLNNNPLSGEEWDYSEEYCDKSIWELAEFLGLR